MSNGGLSSPFDDMAKYLGFLIGAVDLPPNPLRQGFGGQEGGSYESGKKTGGRAEHAVYETVLKRSSLEEMWTRQIRAAEGKA